MKTSNENVKVLVGNKVNGSAGYLNVNGHQIGYTGLGTENLKLEPIGITKKALSKILTGVACENLFFKNKLGTVLYNGYQKTFGDYGYYKGFNLAYHPVLQKTVEDLAESIEYRIGIIKAYVKHIDWLKETDVFGFNGKRIEIKRVTSQDGTFPIRFLVEGKNQTIYWQEFIKDLIEESFEDRKKYLTFKVTGKGFCVIAKVGNTQQLFVICPYKEPEICEFKEIINNTIKTVATFVENALAEQKPKPKRQHPVFEKRFFNPFTDMDAYKVQHNTTQENSKNFRVTFLPPERVNPFENIGEVLSNTQAAILKQIMPTLENNPFVLDGLGKTIREREIEIMGLKMDLEKAIQDKENSQRYYTGKLQAVYNEKLVILENFRTLRAELVETKALLNTYQLREAKIAEVDALTEKIANSKR